MARRPPKPSEDDRRLWKRVTHTVTPKSPTKADYVAPDAVEAALAEMAAILGEPDTPEQPAKSRAARRKPVKTAAVTSASAGESIKAVIPVQSQPLPSIAIQRPAPEIIEPNRKKRLSRERDPIEARIDLHGFGRFEAEDELRAFLMSCQARGMRSVLVITGQGRQGGGVIRSSFEEWMASPYLRLIVSGYSIAHQRHGGNGAFYVTLRQR